MPEANPVMHGPSLNDPRSNSSRFKFGMTQYIASEGREAGVG